MTSASTFSEQEDGLVADIGHVANEAPLLPERPFPKLDDHYLLHGRPSPEGETLIVVKPKALHQLYEHANSNLRSELGGFLLGHAYQDAGRPHIVVEAALPAISDDHGPVHFTFTADSWSQCHQRKQSHYPDLHIVGWYHTHPDLGVFYSSDDVVVHSAGFTLPWHVGLVVDPIRRAASFFGWVEGELENLSGFYELTETTEAPSAVDWHYVNTSVQPFMNYAPTVGYGEQEMGLETAVTPKEWVYVIGSLTALLFFFVAGWIASLNRQVSQLEQVLLTQLNNPVLVAESCPNPQLRILSPLTGYAIPQGETFAIFGTADVNGATRYHVEQRPAGSDDAWTLIGTERFDQSVGSLVRWNTKDVSPGLYELRLTAVDRQNLQLEEVRPCQIQVLVTSS